MRPIPLMVPLLCMCSAVWCADTGLEVVRPIIAQSDGGRRRAARIRTCVG